MAIDKIQSNALDPVKLQQTSKYIKGGLTVVSNNTDIVPRDENGNIIVQDGSYMVIETNSFNINNNTMLKVLDTQFNYFKFPAQVVEIDDDDIDINVDDSQVEQDTIYARYAPIENLRLSDPIGPNGYQPSRPVELEFNKVVRGIAQETSNRYTITDEIKSSGVDLRFRVKIEHRFDRPDPGDGVAYFFVSREGPDQSLQKDYLGPFANTSDRYPERYGSIGQYQVQTLNVDRVITNDQFDIGDTFFISAIGDPNSEFRFHTINSVQTYWTITDASKNVDVWNRETTSTTSQTVFEGAAFAEELTETAQNTIRDR